MYSGKLVFAQLTSYLPIKSFHRCVNQYRGEHKVKSFTCWDQFLCMAFAQLTFRESLRDIESCLRSLQTKLYHLGFRGKISRSTLADANEKRDWRIYADFAQLLIQQARILYSQDDFGLQLNETVYALDSTTIDLCLSVFPWALFRQRKGAVKLHTLLDLGGSIPSVIWIKPGQAHDVKILDELIPEAGAIYLMDRGYLDFERLYSLHRSQAFFVIRAKANFQFQRIYSHRIDKSTGLRCDQTIELTGYYAKQDYPDKLRRIKCYDPDHDRTLVFITNNFTIPAITICLLYKGRWKVELFFKWIKQHLRIKSFFGTTENAGKTQIWIAITVYVLVAIVKKLLKRPMSLYTFLQILSVTLFEKVDILQLVTETDYKTTDNLNYNQLNLFEL